MTCKNSEVRGPDVTQLMCIEFGPQPPAVARKKPLRRMTVRHSDPVASKSAPACYANPSAEEQWSAQETRGSLVILTTRQDHRGYDEPVSVGPASLLPKVEAPCTSLEWMELCRRGRLSLSRGQRLPKKKSQRKNSRTSVLRVYGLKPKGRSLRSTKRSARVLSQVKPVAQELDVRP